MPPAIIPAMRAAAFAAVPLGFVLGTAWQLQQSVLWGRSSYLLLFGAAGAALFIALRSQRALRQRGFAVLLAACVGLGFAAVGLRAQAQMQAQLDPALEGVDLQMVGLIAAMPQRSEAGQRFLFVPESVRRDGVLVQVPKRLLLNWYQDNNLFGAPASRALVDPPNPPPPTLHAGERWALTVRLKAPHGNVNPHGFDSELWFWQQGVQATGSVRTRAPDMPARRLESTWQHPVEQARQRVRDAILAAVPDRQAAGMLAALVVGDQAAIERADWDVFRATGVAHLMSISGLHITMFAWLAVAVMGWSWRRSARACGWLPAPTAALVGGIVLAAGYALFSGWGVPAQRTILMLAMVSLLRAAGRRWPWPQVWLSTGAVVLLVDPWALTQAGFWLSFVAVGILFATDIGANNEGIVSVPTRFVSKSWGALRRMTASQALITLALAPLTLLLFNQLSLVGLPANLLAIPWITLVVTPLALAGVVLTPLWGIAAFAVQLLSGLLEWLAALPFATLTLASADGWTSAAGLVGGLLMVLRLPWSLRLLGLPLLLPWLLWQQPRPGVGQFELLAADIGQGNAVLVRTRAHGLLFDAGPRYSSDSDAGSRVLAPLMQATGERLDLLIVSHSDSDHSGGAAALLRRQPSMALLSSIAPDHPLRALGVNGRCEAGRRWDWDGVQFELLHPRAEDYAAAWKPNAMSCVLRVSNGQQTALLTGDIERAQEARLVDDSQSAPQLAADWLLLPHHGSKTSSSAAFLDAVRPRFAVVQAGYRNRYGHPAAPVLKRLGERDIEVIDSTHCGAALWRSASPHHMDCERMANPHYWRHRAPASAP
ncbi:MAG: DNA internalization-related competence protein ComEC/Rec2 [Burkholderiales bacterium]